jgi:parallel beta-helix repeat protein
MAALQSHNWHGPTSHIILNSCSLYSVTDVSSWSANDWNEKACNGISVKGDSMYIINNYIKNSNFGLTLSCDKSIAYGNVIENFCGDGMRGLGNDLIFESNIVKNCYDVNDNHDDGFQSWSINDDPPRERVVLRGNLIINYEDENQPFKGTLQGIGCFDGPYLDWVVENNVVIVDHWHGISLYGAHNCIIVNNTVIDPNTKRPGPCWIMITDHKNGTSSTNSVIRNNIAARISVADGVTEDHNFIIKSFDSIFMDWRTFNFRLIPNAPVIDSGSSELAPLIDFDGNARPSGNGIDIGAFEYTQ